MYVVHPVQVERTRSTEPEIDHCVCCDVPDDYVGFTTALCGQMILIDGAEEILDQGEIDCRSCEEMSTTDICPLGGTCTDSHDKCAGNS